MKVILVFMMVISFKVRTKIKSVLLCYVPHRERYWYLRFNDKWSRRS